MSSISSCMTDQPEPHVTAIFVTNDQMTVGVLDESRYPIEKGAGC